MTNVVELGARASIEHEARKWLIRMDGDEPVTEAERDDLRQWMDRSPVHRAELLRLTRFWNQANRLANLAGGRLGPGGTVGRRAVQATFVRRILMATGAALAFTVLGWCGLRQWGGPIIRAYETQVGQQKTVFLADGSSMQLNTDTRVEVVYSRNSRKIRLTRGEALFTAASDPNRIFEVHIAESVVRAPGTAFDVYLEGQKIEVVATGGPVEVLDGKSAPGTAASATGRSAENFTNSAQLKAGEVADLYSGSGLMKVRQLDKPELRRRLAWREGYLEFSGEALSEVVVVFNRYSTVKLVVEEPKLAAIAIGGRFQIENLDAAVGLLSETFGFRARRVGDTTIRLESEGIH